MYFVKRGIAEKLYIEVICEAGGKVATAIIAGGHTTFIYIARGEEVLFGKQPSEQKNRTSRTLDLNLEKGL